MTMNNLTGNVAPFRRLDYIKITVFGFALTALWNSLHSVILPLRLLDFVDESTKNTYLGFLTFVGLVLAMLVQPIAGTVSDQSNFRWGRRRPFILLGTIAALLFLPGISLAKSFIVLFIFYCLLQISTNAAQGPFQAFIPDHVPEKKRGLASGVKSLMEIIGGITVVRLIGYFMSRYSPGQGTLWLWLALGTLAAVLTVVMLATVLTVREKPVSTTSRTAFMSTIVRSFKIDVRAKPEFIYFLVSRLLIFMALATLQTFALYFLRDVIRVDNPATATANLVVAIGIGLLAVVYPAGMLADRLGRRPVIMVSGLLGACGILVLLFATSYTTVLGGGAIIGVATGGFVSSNWALATDLVNKGEEAKYLGLTNLATAGGSALARLIGPAIDLFNVSRPGMGYQIMLVTCFAYFVIGSLLVLKIKKQR
jgi:Na+/melibiose symporter-like transporter